MDIADDIAYWVHDLGGFYPAGAVLGVQEAARCGSGGRVRCSTTSRRSPTRRRCRPPP
jgi:hypothetical protein